LAEALSMTGLNELRYFITVAEEGQMTRAARKLHLAQPALSQAIARLESRLDIELLERHPRGVSLTAAGEAFLAKAHIAVAAVADADLTARTLARAARSAVEWGFIGSPPMVDAPELFAAFALAHPDVEVSFRELSFPRGSTAQWLEEVDVALCYTPTPDPNVHIQELRTEPRVVLAAKSHPLAVRDELSVADVLDETFCGSHPSLEPVRAGFWNLDDHRGSPAPHVTADRAINPQELVAVIASGRAITTSPASSGANIIAGIDSVMVIPLRDARPAVLTLAWHKENHNPNLEPLAAIATYIAGLTGTPAR
jgi:DNA-binding transcriptional LysR family regulator